MGYDYTAYRKLLQSLLPKGQFWNRREGSMLTNLLEGFAVELSRIGERIDELMEEKDTRYTSDLLEEYETEYGLPDECSDADASVTERRSVVRARALSRSGLNAQYYIDVVEAYGFDASITLYPDDPILTDIFHWKLTITYTGTLAIIWLASGTGACGDYISYIPTLAPIFCIIDRDKPAWTHLHYEIDGPAFDEAFSMAFDALIPWDGDEDYLEGEFDRAFDENFNVRWGGGFEYTAFDTAFDRPA